MKDFIITAKALSDKNRLRAFMALGCREACVCRLIELLGLAPSTVSKHMAVLKQAGLVQSRKQGRWIYFRAVQKIENPVKSRFIRMTHDVLCSDETVRHDRKCMAAILKQNPEFLCRKQRG